MHLTLNYENMYSETDFRPEIQYVIYWQDKRVSTNEQYEEPSKHIVSIGNHEKGMKNAFFSPLTMKWNMFCASKDHISRGKKRSKFSHLLTVRLGAVTAPPLRSDRKIPVFLTSSLKLNTQCHWVGEVKVLTRLCNSASESFCIYLRLFCSKCSV